jgi:hypothetical protein
MSQQSMTQWELQRPLLQALRGKDGYRIALRPQPGNEQFRKTTAYVLAHAYDPSYSGGS